MKLDDEFDWMTVGSVKRQHPASRSYLIQTDHWTLQWNSHNLRPLFDDEVDEQQPPIQLISTSFHVKGAVTYTRHGFSCS